MCRLLAYAAPADATVRGVMGPALAESFQRMSRVHADGWGTAWVAAGPGETEPDVESLRISTPGQDDPLLTTVLAENASRARLVHLRLATDSLRRTTVNTHPFAAEGIAFAHNGSIVPVDRFDAILDPDDLRDVDGDTDSERYFAVIRREARRLGGDLAAGAAAAVRLLRPEFPTAAFNAMMLAPDELVVVHAASTARVTAETFAAYGLAAEDLPADHDEAYYELRMLREPDGTVVIASSGLGAERWQRVPQDAVLRVDLASLEVEVRPIFGGAGEVARLEPAVAGRAG